MNILSAEKFEEVRKSVTAVFKYRLLPNGKVGLRDLADTCYVAQFESLDELEAEMTGVPKNLQAELEDAIEGLGIGPAKGRAKREPPPPSGEAVCPECGGTGEYRTGCVGSTPWKCKACHGTGRAAGEGDHDELLRNLANNEASEVEAIDAIIELRTKLAAEQQARQAAEGDLRTAREQFEIASSKNVGLWNDLIAAKQARAKAEALLAVWQGNAKLLGDKYNAAIGALRELLEAEREYMTGHVSQERWGAARKAARELLK